MVACGDAQTEPPPTTAELCERVDALDELALPESYAYAWTCSGEVPPDPATPPANASDDCVTGIWPDLDETADICPTLSSAQRVDPVSGKTLPTSTDGRTLPIDIPVSESGSFLPPSLPEAWPNTLRVVAWNMEYTAHLDEQIMALTTLPELANADVYLLSEVDRCSTRNGTRRAARMLAEALQGMYVYGIEFVELDIGRTVGGDTGQAIVSRRPMSGVALTCHSSQYDWFASEEEPRLGQRVVLHADIPIGDRHARVYAVHLESNDIAGDKRAVQAKELLDAAQLLACDRPHIAAGDFNAPYCGAPELEVFRKSGFVDAVATAGDIDPTHANGLRLDYLWARTLKIRAGGVIRGLGASDHDPVWIDLEL